MKAEFERIQNGQPMDLLNMKRYELPGPPAGKQTDVSAWHDAVDNSKAQLEHLDVRFVTASPLFSHILSEKTNKKVLSGQKCSVNLNFGNL
jgi:pre-mRNA-splicing factor SPF27